MSEMRGKILLIALLAAALLLSGCTQPTGCTEEAKVCPDGSTVGRNPALNCEFDPCPEAECIGEGETIPLIAEPPECCAGLTLILPKAADIIGISGYCTVNCGNQACDEIESKYNCPEDCGGLESCGDDICQEVTCTAIGCPIAENPGNCPEDCEVPVEHCYSYTRDNEIVVKCATCGDGICEPYEECTSSDVMCETPTNCIATDDCGGLYCPEDCEEVGDCGNGTCDADESPGNCPEDCGYPLGDCLGDGERYTADEGSDECEQCCSEECYRLPISCWVDEEGEGHCSPNHQCGTQED